MISYTSFWETIKKKNISTYALINKHGFSSATIGRLRHNQPLSTRTLDDICEALNCDIPDIAKRIPNG